MHHQLLPDKPMIITEYGADADRRLRSNQPVKFDKTMDYALQYHKHYLNAFQKLPYVAGATIWNLVEFSSEHREESWPHMNYKGVMSWDRIPKDAYYLYQSKLLPYPVLNIAAKSYTNRTAILKQDKDSTYLDSLEIFTNQAKVRLIINGSEMGIKQAVNHSVIFEAPFKNGLNTLEAISVENSTVKDFLQINYHLLSPDLKSKKHPFTQLKVNLGDDRVFTDDLLNQNWLSEKEYSSGGWGYIGGKKYVISANQLLPYGSSRLIIGTDNDPVYQTQRQNITGFNFDAPNGKYEVTLHFAEVDSANIVKDQKNNLSGKNNYSSLNERSFNVYLNNNLILQNLGTQTYLKPETAISFKNIVDVTDSQGIKIKFEAIKGETILNAIELKRIY
jgi:beta-galactosidase